MPVLRQLTLVMGDLALTPLTPRCMSCGAELAPVEKQEVRERIDKLVGWGLIGLGSLMIPKGYLLGHAFWEESVLHKVWNKLVHLTFGANVAESAAVEQALGDMPVHDPWLLYGPWAIIGLFIAIPILWDSYKQLKAGEEVKPYARPVATN